MRFLIVDKKVKKRLKKQLRTKRTRQADDVAERGARQLPSILELFRQKLFLRHIQAPARAAEPEG